MKSLKGAHFEVSFKENCNGSTYCWMTKERVYSDKVRDGPRYGAESVKGPGERGKVKRFKICLQPRK